MFGLKGSGGMLQGRHFCGERERESTRERARGRSCRGAFAGKKKGSRNLNPK